MFGLGRNSSQRTGSQTKPRSKAAAAARIGSQSFRLLARPAYSKFCKALQQPQRASEEVFTSLLTAYATTAYGRSLGINGKMSYRQFAAQVPLVDYDALAPWIQRERSRAGEICPWPVKFFERTSGSSGREKQIPYTPELKRTFSEMFKIWGYRTLGNMDPLLTGKMFLSISPETVQGKEGGAEGSTTGLGEDSDYLDGALGKLLQPFLCMPKHLRMANPNDVTDILALSLLLNPDLEIISVWNPSYLTILVSHLQGQRERLAKLLTEPQRLAPYRRHLPWNFDPQAAARRLEQGCQPKELWPHLQLISCWDQGLAVHGAAELSALFPHCRVEGKGLLATECPVTIPWSEDRWVPLIHLLWLEIQTSCGETKPLWQMEEGEEGDLIISQQGGLLRYRLGDRIRCNGRIENTPAIRLLGRSESSMDLVGEKLNETFAIGEAEKLGIDTGNSVLLPLLHAGGLGQYLWLSKEKLSTAKAASLTRSLEQGLRESFHYRHARTMGQLKPLAQHHCPNLDERYLAFLQAKGMKLGDIKPQFLLRRAAYGNELAKFFGIEPEPGTTGESTNHG